MIIDRILLSFGYVPKKDVDKSIRNLKKQIKLRDSKIAVWIKSNDTKDYNVSRLLSELKDINKKNDVLNEQFIAATNLYEETERSRKLLVEYNEENKKDAIKYMNLYQQLIRK